MRRCPGPARGSAAALPARAPAIFADYGGYGTTTDGQRSYREPSDGKGSQHGAVAARFMLRESLLDIRYHSSTTLAVPGGALLEALLELLCASTQPL